MFPFRLKKTFYQENFLFSCECEACEEEWPTYSKLPASPPSQKVADKLCEYEMDNMTAMERGEIDKALSFHCKEISLIQVKTTILVGLSGQKDKYIYDPTIFPEQPERAASIVGEREKKLRVGLVAEGGRPHVRQRRPHRRHLSLRSTPGQSLGSSTTAQSISPYNVRARGSTLFWQNSIDPLLKKYIGFSFFVQVHGKQKISKTTFQSASHIYIGRMKYLQEVCCNRRPINGNVVWSHLYISQVISYCLMT